MRFLTCILIAAEAYGAAAPPAGGIAAIHHDGQTFVTWTDPTSGTPGNYRYDVYRSPSPITDAASLAAATLIQSGVFNNSGQQTGQFPYSQATRQDTGKLMSIIEQGSCGSPASNVCGLPLPPLTGLAVHTATANQSAYYAVITRDRTGAETDAPVSPGNNATTSPVAETVAAIQPLKYYDSTDATHRSTGVTITGVANRPLFVNLHASGGCSGNLNSGGDLWQLWGDSTMGNQEGVQQAFAVREYHSTAAFPTARGQLALELRPCDTQWIDTGLGQLETFWFGGLYNPLGQPTGRAWTFTEAFLSKALDWTIPAYAANANKVYCNGQSMGSWGCVSWAWAQRPSTFAAVFASLPRWNSRNTAGTLQIPSMVAGNNVNAAADQVMSDGSTLYADRMNAIALAGAPNCATNRPFIAWGIGREDTFAAWPDQIAMLNALKECRYAFAFAWNNGDHSTGSTTINTLAAQYMTAFAKNVSYPAFTNSSLDDDPDSDCRSGTPGSTCYINAGWSWSVTSDTLTQWSATISNSGGAVTADITPRNTQAFRAKPGGLVAYSVSTGASGMLRADRYGLVTLPAASIAGTTTVSFDRISDLFPMPSGVGR